jgi:hypothetical protein
MKTLIQRRRPSSLSCAIARRGTTVRAQLRSVATLIEVSGAVRADKTTALQTQLRRFVLLDSPLILDLTCVVGVSDELLRRLLGPIEIDCRMGNVALFVVIRHDTFEHVRLDEATEIVGSTNEALRRVVERIRERRNPDFLAPYAPELLRKA